MPVDARIEDKPDPNVSEYSRRLIQSEAMRTVRLIDFRGDANAERPPDYYLYIFNIANRKFEIRRPPNFPLMTFAGCPLGQPYALVGRVPNIVNEKWVDADSGETRVRGIMGERFATDLLNPSNTGIDIWGEIPEELSWLDSGGTDDMTRRGLFWTKNAEPTTEELAMSRAKMEKHYRQLIQHADILYSDTATRREIGREHHMAADYFKARSQWHIVAETPIICENCGEMLKSNVAFHIGPTGFMCVRDWKRTVAAGAVKREQVPEESRWWEDKAHDKIK